jgi:hypothetical protein
MYFTRFFLCSTKQVRSMIKPLATKIEPAIWKGTSCWALCWKWRFNFDSKRTNLRKHYYPTNHYQQPTNKQAGHGQNGGRWAGAFLSEAHFGLKKRTSFFLNYIRPRLPMMFKKKKLSSKGGTRCLVGVFGSYWSGIWRLGKKIGCRRIWVEIKSFPIFLPSLRIPAQQPTNASSRPLVPRFEDNFFLNIIGNG